MGIKTNEIADKKAKEPAKLLPSPLARIGQTLCNTKACIEKGKDNTWQTKWYTNSSSGAIQTYKNLRLTPSSPIKSPPELTMKRELLGWLIATRSGHGHFAEYYKGFQHDEEINIHGVYEQKRAQLHLFSYPFGRTNRWNGCMSHEKGTTSW